MNNKLVMLATSFATMMMLGGAVSATHVDIDNGISGDIDKLIYDEQIDVHLRATSDNVDLYEFITLVSGSYTLEFDAVDANDKPVCTFYDSDTLEAINGIGYDCEDTTPDHYSFNVYLNAGQIYYFGFGTFDKSTQSDYKAKITNCTYVNPGWIELDLGWSFIDENGYTSTGFKTIRNNRYHFDNLGVMATGWKSIDDDTYYFDENGHMITGWKKIEGDWYYFEEYGRMAHSESWYINDKIYYFNENGVMTTGWYKENNTWFYFGEDGSQVTGWKQINGSWYYFYLGGAMATGWVKDNDKWYYLNAGGRWIPESSLTGWKQENGSWYYIDESGKKVTGWKKIDSIWYYFGDDNKMFTGWLKQGNLWYFLDENGAMLNNDIYVISDTFYYFRADGVLVEKEGWLQAGDLWYYVEKNGHLASGWRKINGYWYLFNPEMCANGVYGFNDCEIMYGFDENGRMVTGWYQQGDSWSYFEENGAEVRGWKEIGGVWYYFSEYGIMYANETLVVDGTIYEFDENGHCLNPYA